MIKEIYTAIGGDYENAKKRLMSDRIIEKFVMKFPKDPSFSELSKAVAEEDIEKAFISAHTLKGVAMNLSFTRLGETGSVLTDALRENERENYTWEQYRDMFQAVEEAYDSVILAIEAYR